MNETEAGKLFSKLELVGVSDIARILDWPMSKVTSYRSRETLGNGRSFPKPIGEVGGRPVWTRSQFTQLKEELEKENEE